MAVFLPAAAFVVFCALIFVKHTGIKIIMQVAADFLILVWLYIMAGAVFAAVYLVAAAALGGFPAAAPAPELRLKFSAEVLVVAAAALFCGFAAARFAADAGDRAGMGGGSTTAVLVMAALSACIVGVYYILKKRMAPKNG